MKARGGLIKVVEPGGLAHRLGLKPGDRLLKVNGHPLRDVIDFNFYTAEEELEIVGEREGEPFVIRTVREYGEEWGLEFEEPVFDGIRRCPNQCDFCFIHQLPRGLRPSLYVKDDDYRYSFLFGNYITLTNLTEEDWERLAEQRLSPLYVSVHSTDLTLRRELLNNPSAPDVLEQIRRLGELGILVHAQVVLIPGKNDGPHLERTIDELSALHPTVQSIAVVPVGVTKFCPPGLRPYTRPEAEEVVALVLSRQKRFRRSLKKGLVYLSDEWYFMTDLPIPPAVEYDGFPQLENGVGLSRLFLDNWEKHRSSLPALGFKGMAACGTMPFPLVKKIAEEFNSLTGSQMEVVAIENRLFGPTVTVSGLLAGKDLIEALRERFEGGSVVIPKVMLDAREQLTLDNLNLEDLSKGIGARVLAISHFYELAFLK
ncbi:MAG: DUF512 domain-containing protein [Anaerolineae bacterium]|nr:DUF512 domain-containing protein [Anaerolineae bacterium]